MRRQLSESTVVSQLAAQVAKRLTRKVITQLQRLKDVQSGDDSKLQNVWDEICVQMQTEQSLSWDAYDDTARSLVAACLKTLPTHEQQALWLQTEEGSNWSLEDEEEREQFPVCDENTVEYLLNDHIYPAAGRWSNARIQAYINREAEFSF